MPRMADGRDVPDATFACPDLTTFTRLDELGLEVIGHDSSHDLGRFDGVAVVAFAVKTTLWPFFISPFRRHVSRWVDDLP
jgi:hypothetical protein